MPVEVDFVKYHRSLADEFIATKDRIRNLIGDAHWLTDGEEKEAILRKTLRARLPEYFRVGTGFFCDIESTSNQIDVLITNANKPTLFRDGDLAIVTADCVEAIIEVKTGWKTDKIQKAICKLSKDVEVIRKYNPKCWAGLFVYEGPKFSPSNIRISKKIMDSSALLLDLIRNVCNGGEQRAINCVSYGPDLFVRYWDKQSKGLDYRLNSEGWKSYFFNSTTHSGLSTAYFIGNLVMHLSNDENKSGYAWFPIQTESGKELYHLQYTRMNDDTVGNYDD